MPLPPGAPDLGALDLLLSVAELGSVSKAAQAHGVSQPAASARIQQLERRLGVQLLERSPAGSRLTPAGVTVAQWGDAIVDATRELLAGVSALRAGERARLHVAASMTVAEYLVPRWLAELRAEQPEVTVALRAENSRGVLEDVRAARVDVGFVEDPSPHPDLCARVVATDELVVVVAPRHRWASRGGPLARDELAQGPLVLRERGSGTRETLQHVLGELHEDVPHLELASTTAIKEAVQAGDGAAVLSALAVARELRDGLLVRVEVADVDLRRRLRAVWRGSAHLPTAAMALLSIAERSRRRPQPSTSPISV